VGFELPDFVPTVQFSWTTTAVIAVVVLIVVMIIGNSGLRPGAKRRVTFVSLLGSLGIVWALLYDLGEIPGGGYVPALEPPFFSLWGLAMLVLLPLLFALVGGIRDADYHPRWAPWAYVTKLLSFVSSVLGILGFYLQHLA
jgi:1,4-dihydroxy-2-naphthoate octaprenyltransferase